MNLPEIKNSEVAVFKPKNGQTEFQVVLDGELDTVWATGQKIMVLFGKVRTTIGVYIKNIYKEGELDQESTWCEFPKFRRMENEKFQGKEFQKWATQRLKEYLLKGYLINKELLKKELNKVALLQKELNNLNEDFLYNPNAIPVIT